MTNSRLSPGPWNAITTETKFQITDSEGFPVLRINGGMLPVEANARLISAAPTMASRIQGAIDCLSQHKTFPADIEQAKRLLADALNTAGIDVLPLVRVDAPQATGTAA